MSAYELDGAIHATLADVVDRKLDLKLRAVQPLFGQRLGDLTDLLADGGPLAEPGAKLRDAFAAATELLAWRNRIVHATAVVLLLDRAGAWHWRYRFTPSAKGEAVQTGVLSQDEAHEIEQGLKRHGQRLRSLLPTLTP